MMKKTDVFALGRAGEEKAAKLLVENGYFIAVKNFRSSVGEVDIIAENRDTVVFVEVKLRDSSAGYMPREAVDKDKRRRILHAARSYMYKSHQSAKARFDIIEIIKNKRDDLKDAEVNWIKNAFGVTVSEFY